MAQQTLFLDSNFKKCSWCHAVISITEPLLFSMQYTLRARTSQAPNIDFEPLPIFTSNRLCLSKIPFLPNHVTDLLPVYLISCKMFLQVFLFSITYFSSQTFWRLIAAINFFFMKYEKCHFKHVQFYKTCSHWVLFFLFIVYTLSRLWSFSVWIKQLKWGLQ